MTDWQPIDTAPYDGTVIRVRTEGGLEFRASWQGGLENKSGDECGGWSAEDEATQPACWTDGVCWESNEDGQRSDHPTRWQLLSAPPVVP